MRDAGPEEVRIVLVGAGGFGREVLRYVLDAIKPLPQLRVKGFLDDNSEALQPFGCDFPVVGSIDGYSLQPSDRFVMTIGDPATRAKIIQRLEARGARFISIIHPSAYVAPTATLGHGCIVAPFASVGSETNVGNHVVLTWYASLAHDSKARDFAVLSPYSTANGGATLEEGAFLGTHAVVNPMIRVGAWSKVASGSIVYRHVPPHSLAMGNPAKARPLMRFGASE
jgi:sugar O-acyltransferase (sialic acid O-acetyltransferase NeuD family)